MSCHMTMHWSSGSGWFSYPIVRARNDNIGMTRRGQDKVVIRWFDKPKVLVNHSTDITTSFGDVSSDSAG